jgi:hypothetical protein
MAESLNLLGLSPNKITAGRLAYPNNIFDDYTDYVKFTFYKYKGPFSSGSDTTSTNKDGKTISSVPAYNLYNQAGQQFSAYEGVVPIYLYMPEDVSTGYQTDWGGKGFTNVATQALRGGGSALNGNVGGTVQAIIQQIQNTAGAVPTAGAEAIAGAINNLPGGLGGGNITTQDILQGSLGVILNPNTELMFTGFQMRQFSLRFKLVPRNDKEAKDIRNIVYTFKKIMLPTLGKSPGGIADITGAIQSLFKSDSPPATPPNAVKDDPETSNANYIGVPGLCQVQFMKGTTLHPYLPQFKVCAITGVDVNYTPDGSYATYREGSPVATELSLNFTETKLVYSQDILPNGPSY